MVECEDAVEKKIDNSRKLRRGQDGLWPVAWRPVLGPPNNIKHSMLSSQYEYKEFTHHFNLQLGNGLDERPNPFPICLRVNDAGPSADNRAPRALLWVCVYIEEVQHPTQMLVDEEVPHGVHGTNACSEELVEVPCLPAGRPNGTGPHLVLDVLCRCVLVNVVNV